MSDNHLNNHITVIGLISLKDDVKDFKFSNSKVGAGLYLLLYKRHHPLP